MSTPNNGIPYVPEDTQDPAAGLNLALNVIDALLQTAVIDMDLTAPPGSPSDGDLHIVAGSATGAWTGQDNNLARYVAEGAFWQFYEAGTNVHIILNSDDGGLYVWNGSTWVAPITPGSVAAASVSYDNATSGLSATDVQDAIDELETMIGGAGMTNPMTTAGDIITGGSSGTPQRLAAGADTQVLTMVSGAPAWAESGPGGVQSYTIVTEGSAFTADPGTHDGLTRYNRCAGDVTFDSAEPYTAGMVFNFRATAAIELIEDGVTLTVPAGGTLELDAGMSVQVVMTSTTTGDVIGQTVAAP